MKQFFRRQKKLSAIFVYGILPLKKWWIIEKEKKTTCIKIFCSLFTEDYDFVKLSAGSCSVSVGGGRGEGGQMDSKGRVSREMDCCSHSNRGNPPFALSLSGFAHRSTCGRHAPALPKHLAWRGEGTETPVPTMWPSIFFSCLSVVLAESSVWGFFAVFELVASAFLRAVSRLQVALPSLTSLFSNLKGI